MATLQQLETALVNADRAGDADAARRLAAAVKAARADSASQIPGAAADMGAAVTPPAGPSLVDRAIGAGEAGLTAITAPIAYLNGLAAGGNTLVKRLLAEAAGQPDAARFDPGQAYEQAAQAATYTPRTESGQEQAAALAQAGQGLAPLAGLTGQMGQLAQATRAARTGAPVTTTARAAAEGTARDIAGPSAAAAVSTAVDATSRGAQALKESATLLPKRTAALVFGEADAAPTAGTRGSAGAAGTDMAAQRIATAESLGFAGDKGLTVGQATRDFGAQQFEREQAKVAGTGAPLRDRFANQNAHLAARLDSEIDNVGAVAPDVREAGRAVTTELANAAARSKREYRAQYQAADRAGELRAPVNLDALVDYLNQAAPEASTAPLVSTARGLAIKMGIAREQGGQLVPVRGGRPDTLTNAPAPGKVTLKTAETFRQAINRNIDTEPTNIRQGTIIKQLIDEATEGQGGDAYRSARKARQRHAQLFEDNAIVSDLLALRRGTADRRVALEDVFKRTILNGDRESLGLLRRTLDVSDQRAGFKPGADGPGAQAWRELQGSTLRHLLEQATSNVATDVAGNAIFSAAKFERTLQALEHGNRLEFLLGKQRAQLVRDLNEVAKVITTAPPGAVNTSNTASAVMAAIAEAGLTGSVTGLPVPVLSTLKAGTQFVRDVKLRRRVQAALNGAQRPTSTTP
jgi:hypothetical protein